MTHLYQQSLSTYASQQVEMASPEQLLLMLYDGAIRFMNEAMRAHGESDLETYNNKLIKTQDIISELMSSLDMTMGGVLADNLFRLYEYLHYRLVQANVKKDLAMLEEVLVHMKDLRSTWQQAIEIAKREERGQREEQESVTSQTQTPEDSSSEVPVERSFSA